MNWSDYSSSILSLIILLAIFYGAVWGLRRYSNRLSGTRFGQAVLGSGKTRQLKMLEALSLDTRRRLVRVQNGGREYVFLIGGTNDILVDNREVGHFSLAQEDDKSPDEAGDMSS